MSVIEAVTVTLYRATNKPKGARIGKPRRQKRLAYRDAAWATIRRRCRCVLPGVPAESALLCRYHDRQHRAVDWPNPYPHEEATFFGFRAPVIWRLPRSGDQGYWDYGRAVAYRLARWYRHLDDRAALVPGEEG
jgi:hypothetical protein